MRGWGKHRLVSRPLSRQHQETKEHGKAGTAIHIPGCNLSAVIRNGERYAVSGSAPADTAQPLSCMCIFVGPGGFKSSVRRGRSCHHPFVWWQVAIDKPNTKTLQYQELSYPMAPVRTTHRKETPDQIEYGEAILVALKLKAERQLEVIAPDQHDNLLVFCRLMLDIQAVQEKLSRERWRISVCR